MNQSEFNHRADTFLAGLVIGAVSGAAIVLALDIILTARGI